eukprot:2563130-Pleurochrysis_carterae.AAC.1
MFRLLTTPCAPRCPRLCSRRSAIEVVVGGNAAPGTPLGVRSTLYNHDSSINLSFDSCPCARRRAAMDPRLPRATNQLLTKSSLRTSDYTMVKRVGVVPASISVLMGSTVDVSSQNLHGLNALELPEHVYEVDLSALAMRQYQSPCGCGVNMITNGVCKHAWIAITALKEDVVRFVNSWATTAVERVSLQINGETVNNANSFC